MNTAQARVQALNVTRFKKIVKKLERSARRKADKAYEKLDFWKRMEIGTKSSLVAAYAAPFAVIFKGIEYGKAVGGDVYDSYEGKRLQEFSETSKKNKKLVSKVVALAVECNLGDRKRTAKLMKLPVSFVRKCCKYQKLEVDVKVPVSKEGKKLTKTMVKDLEMFKTAFPEAFDKVVDTFLEKGLPSSLPEKGVAQGPTMPKESIEETLKKTYKEGGAARNIAAEAVSRCVKSNDGDVKKAAEHLGVSSKFVKKCLKHVKKLQAPEASGKEANGKTAAPAVDKKSTEKKPEASGRERKVNGGNAKDIPIPCPA